MLLASVFRMPRLRILLFILFWYYAVTKASAAEANAEPEQSTAQTRNDALTQQIKEDAGTKSKPIVNKAKREIANNDGNEKNDDEAERNKRPEKNRRKVGSDYLDVIDTENTRYLKHLANLISKYRGQYVQYGFVVGKAEDIIDLDMIKRCMTPVEIPKHFSPWLGKRGAIIQDAMQKKCLETLVQPVDYRPSSYATDDGRYLKPFRPWGGKRNYDESKRTNFGAWGGKRDNDNMIPAPKKAKFRAWGGKRATNFQSAYDYPAYGKDRYNPFERQTKDSKFSAWGGKRDPEYPMEAIYPYEMHPVLYDIDDGTFNAWGGKRDPEDLLQRLNMPNPYLYYKPYDIERQSRNSKFNAWGGKRDSNEMDSNNLLEPLSVDDDLIRLLTDNHQQETMEGDVMGQSLFPLDGEDLDEPNSNQTTKTKRNFSAWGGKRSNEPQSKRFHPWKG